MSPEMDRSHIEEWVRYAILQ